ncbi:phage virion morphogenesis (putative tail completion) protein [Novosphingobium sp. CF614]|uniref:phage virion morphogenesis protein n=1 Tax=Novosphingobium sp. CF614 TaxID=1884364 RepID=UPI0008E4243B|nr:phage virion morphogenesis protein [Novosphingobium sp. CF614]SFG08432.1 phage virion morphogenesis (putative tail completion) protein [Novosphingobium sp. CF614]
MAEDLRELEEWLGGIVNGLEPARRRRAALKLGQALRRANLLRIAANVEPEGGAMAPRKPRLDRGGGLRGKAGGKMFRRLRLTRSWRIAADAEGVEIAPASAAIDRVAAVHHFGETDTVGRDRRGGRIRARYAARRLLGFAEQDRALALEIAAALLDPDAS